MIDQEKLDYLSKHFIRCYTDEEFFKINDFLIDLEIKDIGIIKSKSKGISKKWEGRNGIQVLKQEDNYVFKSIGIDAHSKASLDIYYEEALELLQDSNLTEYKKLCKVISNINK